MSAPTDNNKSVKEYNEISKCKDLEIEIEKAWHLPKCGNFGYDQERDR